MSLQPGINIFNATAGDQSGNVSAPSDDLTIVYDTSLLPDLAITAYDIFTFPAYPIAGQTAVITATVRNIGQVDVKDVAVDIYIQGQQGTLTLLQSMTIPSMAGGSRLSVEVTVDTTGKAGTNKIIFTVDQQNQIEEIDETNNIA